jgi:hypothetical protein
VKKEQNGRKSLRRLKPTVSCNASKKKKKKKKKIVKHNLVNDFIKVYSYIVSFNDIFRL